MLAIQSSSIATHLAFCLWFVCLICIVTISISESSVKLWCLLNRFKHPGSRLFTDRSKAVVPVLLTGAKIEPVS